MDFELTDEQRLVRETARAFTDNEIVERARENDRNEHFDLELVREDRGAGLPRGDRPARVRRCRARLPDLRADRRGDRPRGLGDADRDLRPDVARVLGARALGHRGAEAALPAEAVLGRVARVLRPDRARHRLGRRQPAHAREEDRLGLGDQRRQDVHLDGQLRASSRSCSPRPIPTRRIAGWRASSSTPTSRATSRQAIHHKIGLRGSDTAEIALTTSRCPTTRCSARSATASRSR